MMSGGLNWIASRFGDVLGTALYDHYGGFAACVIAITAVYTLILPTLLLVPKSLIATADWATARVRERDALGAGAPSASLRHLDAVGPHC